MRQLIKEGDRQVQRHQFYTCTFSLVSPKKLTNPKNSLLYKLHVMWECLCLSGLPKNNENIFGIFEFVQRRKEIFAVSFISDLIDHVCSYAHNKAVVKSKPVKTRIYDLCDTGVMLYQVRYCEFVI